MVKEINVGLIGFGTIGGGLVNQFIEQKPSGINLETVVEKDLSKHRKSVFYSMATEADDVINNPDIDIIVELIGGYHPAREYIINALENGKHVVTANKALISKYGPEIFETAKRNKVNIGFEAAVGGGIEIINSILDGQLSHENITGIVGILNGTTNFILTNMSKSILQREKPMTYDAALKMAKEAGFAESDPSFDVEGKDAAQKISILASLAFGTYINPDDVYTEGITEITPTDFESAEELNPGYTIKLLAMAKKTEHGVDLRVHPALIRKSHQLANIENEFNAVYIEGTYLGSEYRSAKGAGREATSLSVYTDIVKIANMMRTGIHRPINMKTDSIQIADQNKIITRGYLRMNLKDVPVALYEALGIISKKYKWNLKDSIQSANNEFSVEGKTYIPDIITHSPLEFGIVKQTLEDLTKLSQKENGPIYGKPFYMRIYDR